MNYEKLNHVFNEQVFEYNGPVFTIEDKNKISFKFNIVGTKDLIHIGDWVKFYLVDVEIVKINKPLLTYLYLSGPSSIENLDISKIKSGNIKPNDLDFDKISEKFTKTNLITWGLETEIESLLKFANIEHVKINKINFNLPNKNFLTEQRMSRKATRDVVRDIVNILKTNKKGKFILPGDEDFYTFKNYPLEFIVELDVRHDKKMEGFKINGSYVPEEEIVELLIICNPKTLKRDFYNIIGELNEILTHELEHGRQEYRGDLGDVSLDTKNNLEYYLQPHEIQAQVKGFRRISKLKKVPFNEIVRHWFDTHKDVHGLNSDEEKIVIDELISYNSNN